MNTGILVVLCMVMGSIAYSLWSISISLQHLTRKQNVEVSFDPSIEFPPQLLNSLTHTAWEAGQNFRQGAGR